MGASRAVKQLQEAMNAAGETQLDHYSPIAEDGIMGPDTRELANALADVHLDWYAARSSLRLRDAFYRRLAASRPSMKVFLTGWRNRVKALHQCELSRNLRISVTKLENGARHFSAVGTVIA